MASSRSDHFAKSERMLTLVSITVIVAILYVAKGVLVPLMLASLLSFLLAPACDWFERWRLGRIPAVLVTAVIAFAALGAVAWTASIQMVNLAPKLPEYQSNIQTKLYSANRYVSNAVNRARRTTLNLSQNLSQDDLAEKSPENEDQPFPVRVISSPTSPLQVIGGLFGSLIEVFGSAGIVIVLVVFFLLQREDLRDRFIRLAGGSRVAATTQALEDATERVRRYLMLQLFVNVTFGICVAVGLYFIGLPGAILWGFLATVLRFIPYIGPWIAATMPIGLSLVISTDWVPPILTIGLFVVLELLSNNIMEPWIYGKNTGVSSVAILLAAVFWTWLWGPIGLLLATPLTVCLLVIGKHVPQLAFFDTMLGDEPVFDTKTRVYQRLLAGDMEEASELIEDAFEHSPLVEVYDTVLIPALASAQTNWQRGNIDEDRHNFMFRSLKETVEDLGERQQETKRKEVEGGTSQPSDESSPVNSTDASRLSILCLPARDEADELAGMMLAQVLDMTGCRVEAASAASLVSEMVEMVKQRNADVVCISAMPPAAAMHARYLCKRLRGRFPGANLIVGLWNFKGDLSKARDRIGCDAQVHVVGTLTDAQEQIRRLLPSLLLRPKEQVQSDCTDGVMV